MARSLPTSFYHANEVGTGICSSGTTDRLPYDRRRGRNRNQRDMKHGQGQLQDLAASDKTFSQFSEEYRGEPGSGCRRLGVPWAQELLIRLGPIVKVAAFYGTSALYVALLDSAWRFILKITSRPVIGDGSGK